MNHQPDRPASNLPGVDVAPGVDEELCELFCVAVVGDGVVEGGLAGGVQVVQGGAHLAETHEIS